MNRVGGRALWGCNLPDCSHFLPGNMAGPPGKMSLCHVCYEPFMLTEENMKYDNPICTTCAVKEKTNG